MPEVVEPVERIDHGYVNVTDPARFGR